MTNSLIMSARAAVNMIAIMIAWSQYSLHGTDIGRKPNQK